MRYVAGWTRSGVAFWDDGGREWRCEGGGGVVDIDYGERAYALFLARLI